MCFFGSFNLQVCGRVSLLTCSSWKAIVIPIEVPDPGPVSEKFITYSLGLFAKGRSHFLKVAIQKKPFFKKFLHRSIIFVFHEISTLLLFGNFDEQELRVSKDNLSEVWFGTQIPKRLSSNSILACVTSPNSCSLSSSILQTWFRLSYPFFLPLALPFFSFLM